jgi:chromosome segregation ATPase
LAKLKEQEKSALSALNLAKNELLTLDKMLDKADLEQKQAIAQYANSQYKLTAIQTSIDANEKLLVVVDKEITNLQSNYNQLQTKYESLDKAAQSVAAKAAESKKKSDAAYQELMAASNSKSLVANGFDLNMTATPEVDIESFNATSALEKLRERYQNALEQANKDKAMAERALRDLQIAREAAVKAKQSLDLKITQRSKLKSELTTLNSKLKVAKDELEVATSIKVKAVSAYSIAANNLAQKTNKLREAEINYLDAQSETKYEFENANSRDNQVAFLRKLSELSKSSVATARGVIDSIDEEFKNLESSQALDLITTEVKIGFLSTSIPVILFTAASAIAIYAYLARRKRRSKFDLASTEMLAKIREQQSTLAVKKKSVKGSKAKSVGTRKKPKSSKGNK